MVWNLMLATKVKWAIILGYTRQCVKTNSTPSVHIKIAGIYGCSSPKNGIFIGIDP